MAKGASKIAGPKSMRDIQIESLEKSWGGYAKALTADKIKVGDRIDGAQYEFDEMREAPYRKAGAWSGEYNGIKMKISAENNFRVTGVEVGKNKTKIKVEKTGGAPMTAEKTISNDTYLKVYGRK